MPQINGENQRSELKPPKAVRVDDPCYVGGKILRRARKGLKTKLSEKGPMRLRSFSVEQQL